MKRLFIFIAFILNSIGSAYAQSYEDAINLLKENKRTEAAKILKDLQVSGKDKAYASLALCLTDLENAAYVSSFNNFKLFFDNSTDPYPYFYALSNTGIFTASENYCSPEVEKFCTKISVDPKANCSVQTKALEILASFKEAQNDFDAARKIYNQTCDISNWSTVGPFENVSGSGFNKNFGVLEHPEPDHDFTNKYGSKVRWFDIWEVRNDRWQDMTYFHAVTNSIVYSQTFISSDADKEVLLMTGVSGSVKIWLNDFLIGQESEERNTNQDVYTYKVKLQKGANRILIQTGSSEIDRNNFLVRLADLNGNLCQGVYGSSTYRPYNKASAYETTEYPFFAESFFEKKLSADNNNFIDKVLLLRTYLHNDKIYNSHKILAELKKMAPTSSMISNMATTLAKIEKNTIVEGREKESIKINDPDGYTSLALKCSDAITKEKWDDALEIINQLIKLYGNSPIALSDLYYILIKKKETPRANEILANAYEKYPYYTYFAEAKYQNDLEGIKDVPKSRHKIEEYIENHYSENVLVKIIEAELKKGDKEEAINLYKLIIGNSPIKVGYYLKLAALYTEIHKDNDALDYLNKALKISPHHANLLIKTSDIYERRGDSTKAIQLLQSAVNSYPSYFEGREKLRSMQHKKDIFDSFIKEDVQKLYVEALHNNKYLNDEGVVLLKDAKMVVYPESGANEQQTEFLILINSQSIAKAFSHYNVPYNSSFQKMTIEKAELLKKDGSRVPAEKEKNDIVFSTIGIGDAVHLIVRVENNYPTELATHFWDAMSFNAPYPTQISRYSMLVPQNKKFDYKFSNQELTPKVDPVEDFYRYVWEEDSIPKIIPEKLMTDDYDQKITVTSIPDWSYVANWYSDVSTNKTIAGFEVKEKVKELMTGNEKKTKLEKARIIYNYIENNINYSHVSFLQTDFIPQNATKTLDSKLGDCKDLAVLFVSMAKEAGLDANLVLVRTRGSTGDIMPLPTISFNHCIAQLHIRDSVYLIELTSSYLPFASLVPTLINANALSISENGENLHDAQLVKLNTKYHPQNISIRNSALSFTENTGILERKIIKIGGEAAGMRSSLKDKTSDEKQKHFTDIGSKEFKKDVIVQNLDFRNLDNLNDSLFFEYKVIVDNFCTEVVGYHVFKIPWTDLSYIETLTTIFSDEKRTYPIDFEYFEVCPEYKETITISLPKGKKIAETPKDVEFNCSAISYSVKYKLAGNKLTAIRDIKFHQDIIKPDQYNEIKEIVAKIDKADKKDIAFK